MRGVRLRRGEARRLAEAHAQRRASLLQGLRLLTLDPVLLESEDPEHVGGSVQPLGAARSGRRRRR